MDNEKENLSLTGIRILIENILVQIVRSDCEKDILLLDEKDIPLDKKVRNFLKTYDFLYRQAGIEDSAEYTFSHLKETLQKNSESMGLSYLRNLSKTLKAVENVEKLLIQEKGEKEEK